MSFKKIRDAVLEELAYNVFMLVEYDGFDPDTFSPSVGIPAAKIIGCTTGGVTFADTPEYIDLGEDIDNCPKNTIELKRKKDGEVKLSGTLVTVNYTLLKQLIGAATIDHTFESSSVFDRYVAPSEKLSANDFDDIWAIGDYGTDGMIAIKLKNILNTGGLSISTTDDGKMQFAFEFTCHKSIYDIGLDKPNYEVYIAESTSS